MIQLLKKVVPGQTKVRAHGPGQHRQGHQRTRCFPGYRRVEVCMRHGLTHDQCMFRVKWEGQ